MSKLLIAQIICVIVAAFAMLVIGVQIFGWGHIRPEEILPWAYVALAGWVGMLVCLFIRLSVKFRRIEKKLGE